MSENILEKANKVVAGDRNEQYGSIHQSFDKYSKIVNLILSESEKEHLRNAESEELISPSIISKVMIAIKLGRESYKHKEDNLLDLAGYTHILNELENA